MRTGRVEVVGHDDGAVTVRFDRVRDQRTFELVAQALLMAAAGIEAAPVPATDCAEQVFRQGRVETLREFVDRLATACTEADELVALERVAQKRRDRADARARAKRESGQEALV